MLESIQRPPPCKGGARLSLSVIGDRKTAYTSRIRPSCQIGDFTERRQLSSRLSSRLVGTVIHPVPATCEWWLGSNAAPNNQLSDRKNGIGSDGCEQKADPPPLPPAWLYLRPSDSPLLDSGRSRLVTAAPRVVPGAAEGVASGLPLRGFFCWYTVLICPTSFSLPSDIEARFDLQQASQSPFGS